MLKTLIKMQFSALASQTIMRTRKGRATNKTSPGKIILYSLLLLLCFGYLSVIFGVIFLMLESMTAETAQNLVDDRARVFYVHDSLFRRNNIHNAVFNF